MAEIYIHGVPVNKLGRRTRKLLKSAAAVAIVLAGAALYLNIRGPHRLFQPVTTAQTRVISASTQTTISPYFQFQDSAKWDLLQNDSNATTFVYARYRGSQPQQLLYVYVNRVPIPLDLATSYVLPVRVSNNNSFDVTSVSGPCLKSYGGQPYKVKEVTIQLATMLCDPSNAEYSVQLAQIGGNYQITMRRPNGQPIQFIIIYKDVTGGTQPDSLLNIANSFKAL